jgi:prepilin-type N-terminal cleavage/methylation domain-containing protein
MKKHTTLKSKFNSAFSLIELLVVIAVIAVIAAIAIPNITGVTDAARTAQATENSNNIVRLARNAMAAGSTVAGDPVSVSGAFATWSNALTSSTGVVAGGVTFKLGN